MKITLSNGVSVNVDDSYADLPPAEQEATKQYILEQWQASQAKPKEAESTPPGERSAFVPGAIGSAAGVTFGGTLHRAAMEKFPTTPPAATTTTTAAGKPSVTTQFISPEKVEERILKSGMSPNVREKVAGAGQPANWMRTAAGETHELPEKFFQQATSMRGSGAEGGAQTLIDRDLKNLEKIKDIGASDFKLSGAADTQLMLPKEVATERQAQLEGRAKEAGETRAKRLGALEQARLAEQAKAQAEAAKPINRLKEFGQQAASKVTAGGGELLSKLTQPFASNLTTKALTGFGAGYGGYDALQRFQRDEYLRGLLSLIGAGGDIATMSRHPAAMVPGLVAGLGAPALNMYLDKLAAEGKLPKGFANGGLAYLSNGGSSEKSEPFVGYPQIKRKGPSPNFVPQRGAAVGYLDALLGAGPQTTSVLDPKSKEYLEAYEKAEPYGIALMAAPFLGGPAKSLGRALGPKAAEMTENYLTRLGGIQNITPASNRLISSNKLPEFDIRFDKRVGEQEKLKNLRTTTENYQPNVPTVSLPDFVGRPFVTSMSDRTAGGKYLLGINDVDLKRPVNLLGGLPYMFNNPGQTWASAPGPVKQIMREAQMAKEFTGKEPLYIPWRMAPTGSDFAHMTGETMLAYAESAMGRDQKKALNNAIKNIYPDWKGIDNPASMEQFKSAPSKVRKQIQHVLNRDFRDEGGLSIGETRLAITDPRQATGKEGTILDIGEIFSDKPIIQVSGHASYPKGVPGRGIGTLDKEFNIFELMPKAVKQRGIKDPRNPSTEDIRALQMKPYTGILTEDLLKQLGYAEGGEVQHFNKGKIVRKGLDFILPPAENAARTQIVGTIPTYKKAGEMFTERGATGQALDFSAGLGKGAEFLGPNTLTYEPFAQGWKPTFSKASEIPSDAFGKVANLNSLNVVPRETRDQMVLDIGRAMERGGHGIITTRGPEVMTAKGVPGPEPTSIITSRDTYQKGFTKQELEDYIRYMLGKGYDIDKIKLGPAGVYIQKKADGGLVEGMTAMDSNAAVDPLMPQPMPVSLERGPDVVTNRMMPLDFTTMQAPMAMGETTPDMAPGLQALSSPMPMQAMTPTAAATQPMGRLMPPPITMSRPMGGLMPRPISQPMLKPRMPGIAGMPKRYFR